MRVKIISILPEELASAQSRGSIRGSIQRTPVHDGERRLIVIDPELSVLLLDDGSRSLMRDTVPGWPLAAPKRDALT
jgi:hypothetical protein